MTRRIATGNRTNVIRHPIRVFGVSPEFRRLTPPVGASPSDTTFHAPISAFRQQTGPVGNRATSARRRGGVRDGYTLLDTLVIATAMAFLLGVTGSIFQVLSQTDRQIRRQQDLHRTIFRLSNQFREDVHAARIAEVSGNGGANVSSDRLKITLDNGRLIEYERNEGRIQRIVLEAQRVIQREEFPFPEAFAPRWEQLGGEIQNPEITLVIPRRTVGENENTGERDLLRISATVGFDHRFHPDPSPG